MGERDVDVPSAESVLRWLEENFDAIVKACEQFDIPKPPPT